MTPATIWKKVSRFRTRRREREANRRQFGATFLPRGITELRRELGVDEQLYERVGPLAIGDARSYYLYGVLDDLMAATMALMGWEEDLVDLEDEGDNLVGDISSSESRNLQRSVIAYFVDEQALWIRKTSEHLVDLICFGKANTDDGYRCYLAAAQLDAYLGLLQDFREFYSCDNRNISESISICAKEAERLSGAKPWFLRQSVNSQSLPRPGGVFASARNRYKQALQLATQGEKVALGGTYETIYSRSSRSLHANVGGARDNYSKRDLKRNASHVSLLVSHALVRSYELAGVRPIGVTSSLSDMLLNDKTDAPGLFRQQMEGECAVGDLVAVFGSLAHVASISESSYGYRSAKVSYVSRPPIPDIVSPPVSSLTKASV